MIDQPPPLTRPDDERFDHENLVKTLISVPLLRLIDADSAFRQVVTQKKVRGQNLITHTRSDKAAGIAYPIALRIAGQVAAAPGDENDIFGGLGSNGAQNAQTTSLQTRPEFKEGWGYGFKGRRNTL